MSNLENKKQEETPKKRPYNLREKKEKKAAYRSLIRPELADELYDKILNIVVVQKKYRDPDYSAFSFRPELFLLAERIQSERRFAFIDRQEICR